MCRRANRPIVRGAYPLTPLGEANQLLRRSGTALLIGLCLDQQVRTEKAFSGPLALRERLGHLDARKIADMPVAKLDSVFRRPAALHRFPGMMAKRVRALCAVIANDYAGDGSRLWSGARTAAEVYERLRALPGFGEGKAAVAVSLLARHGKKNLPGWRRYYRAADAPWEFKDGKKVH